MLLAANRGDKSTLMMNGHGDTKSTSVADLFVPKGTPTRKALVGAALAAKLLAANNQPSLMNGHLLKNQHLWLIFVRP